MQLWSYEDKKTIFMLNMFKVIKYEFQDISE